MAHLITNIDQVKEYVNVSNGLNIKTLRPALNEVEMQELTFYLGNDLLTEIIAQVNSSPLVITPRIEKIYKYVMAAAVGVAIFKAGPEIEVIVNDNGILRQETNTEKTAYGGQVKRFRDTAGTRGYRAIDSFLAIMENYAQDYPEWQDSEYFALREGLMIRTAKEFEEAGESIKNSSLTFQALRPIIKEIQETNIKDLLPDEMYISLLEDPSDPDNSTLLKNYIRPAIAKLTIEQALTDMPVELDHESVTVNHVALAGDARVSAAAPIHLIEKKAWGLRGRGGFYISNLKEYLNSNASANKYPLWYNSEHFSKTLKAQIKDESLHPDERKVFRA